MGRSVNKTKNSNQADSSAQVEVSVKKIKGRLHVIFTGDEWEMLVPDDVVGEIIRGLKWGEAEIARQARKEALGRTSASRSAIVPNQEGDS